MDALGNSLWVAVFSALGSTLLGLLAVLAGSGIFLGSMLALAMVLPEIVFALILLTWFAFWVFDLGLFTVILAHITFSVSFSYLIIRSRFEKLDPLLFEAAADLGAGGLGRLFVGDIAAVKTGFDFLLFYCLSFVFR